MHGPVGAAKAGIAGSGPGALAGAFRSIGMFEVAGSLAALMAAAPLPRSCAGVGFMIRRESVRPKLRASPEKTCAIINAPRKTDPPDTECRCEPVTQDRDPVADGFHLRGRVILTVPDLTSGQIGNGGLFSRSLPGRRRSPWHPLQKRGRRRP